MAKRRIKTGSGFLRKEKDAFTGGRSESSIKDWVNPVYTGNLKIDNREYDFELYQATNKWGRTDIFAQIFKLVDDNDMGHVL